MTVILATAALVAVFLAVFSTPAAAKVTGPCGNCHTMHNSQGGSNMQTGYDSGSDAQATLLRANGCLGCHGATNGATWQGVGGAPVVFNFNEPAFNAAKGLAGGNFYWVSPNSPYTDPKRDACGHNVFSDNPDTLTPAPGGFACGSDSCHDNIDKTSAGSGGLGNRQGCTKCHMVDNNSGPKGFHHADDSAAVINSFPWYRFLKGHGPGNSRGVTGIEDGDWEQETSTDHNEYLGAVVYGDEGLDGLGVNTMTAFCSGCHGDFHDDQHQGTEAEGNAWIRHPSDAVLPTDTPPTEYDAYMIYNPQAPVARPESGGTFDWTGSSNTVYPGEDMVMCLSCHRPHGSPYPDMLRWDYDTMNAGGGGADGTGCFICHTNKDDA